jgi:hypothetical protein
MPVILRFYGFKARDVALIATVIRSNASMVPLEYERRNGPGCSLYLLVAFFVSSITTVSGEKPYLSSLKIRQ